MAHPALIGTRLARFERAFDLLYPPRCAGRGCGRPGAWLCSECLDRVRTIPTPCSHCAAPMAIGSSGAEPPVRRIGCVDCRRLGPWPFEGVAAVGLYEGALRDAVRACKYRGIAPLGALLGHLAADAAQRRWNGQPPLADIVVPVPGDSHRIRDRGIDHALVIARGVGVAAGLPVAPDLVRRTRVAPRQVGLLAQRRATNLEGAFVAAERITGAVLLVDDVFTTGATARAAAIALVQAGASVRVAVVARTDRTPVGHSRPDSPASDLGDAAL